MTRRISTAAVAIPGLLAALWLGTAAIGALAVVAAGIGGWELAGMARRRERRLNGLYFIAWPVLVVFTGWLIAEDEAGWWLLPTVAGAGAIPALVQLAGGHRTAFAYALAAGPYAGVALAHGPLLRASDDGAEWLLLALGATFAADSAAMLVGLAVGRHRLAPAISPGKTWEGAAGGLAGGAIAALAIAAAFDLEIAAGWAFVLGIVMAVAGTLGDLGESALKRHAGVKDSGFLVPGHGGVLDRLDSLMPNIAIVYWVSEWSAT